MKHQSCVIYNVTKLMGAAFISSTIFSFKFRL